ncbi:MAG TPA: tetratricopeptide repeat protein, partial [Bryobacteraceae bacterium]|nr:tetratricopeptide repeat protein [Bryobacteraceae bacterium]
MMAAAALALALLQANPPAGAGANRPVQPAVSTTQQQLAEACRLRPNDPDTHFQLGVFQDSRKAHAEAVAAFRRVVELRPNDARAWDYLALHLEALGQVDEAEAAFRKGASVNRGRYADAYLDYNFGRLLAKRNRLADSLPHFDRALGIAPPTRAIHY